jgi:hypothetical protein
LVGAHATCNNLRLMVILSAHRRACQAPLHRDLADVRERISYRSLEKFFRGIMQRVAGGQVGIECFKSCKETPDLRIPWERR